MKLDVHEMVKDPDWDPQTDVRHRNGIAWWKATLPRRLHRCRVQTMGCINFKFVERCACGAIRGLLPSWPNVWMDRNSRRRGAGGPS